MPKLVFIQGNWDKDEIQIVDRITIGRGLSNDVKILDHNVSRQHAVIENIDGDFRVRDLASTNGTMINGVFIQEKFLTEGDQLQIGKNIFLFERDSTRIALSQNKHPLADIIDDRNDDDSMDITMEVETRTIKLLDDELFTKQPRRELIKAHRKLSVLLDIGKTISTHTQLLPLLSNILESLLKVLPVRRGVVFLVDQYSNELLPVFVKSKGEQEQYAPLSVSNKIVSHVQRYKKGILTTEIQRVASKNKTKQKDVRLSVMCIPLFIKDELIGLLWVDNVLTKASFSPDDLELFTAVAQQTSMAIENIRLTQDRIKGESSNAFGEIISSFAHEIKNPLSSILIYTELLKTLHTDQKQEDYCKVILNELNRLLNITNQVLDYGQNIMIRLEDTDITNLLHEITATIDQRAHSKNITLEKSFHPELKIVPLDSVKMKQVLINVLFNAIDATGNDGKIFITTTQLPQKKYFRISIADTGSGIQPDMIGKIFEPFFSSKKNGTGLGLSISQKIVEEHQGRIHVESDLQQGTTFHIDIPLKRQNVTLPKW